MSTILALQPGLIRQPQIRLMNQCGRLECAIAVFAAEAHRGNPEQLAMDDRRKIT
jgi:hypothetical protein